MGAPDPLMRSCLVEVRHIRIEDALELPLMQDQQVVQAFLSDASQEALAEWHWLVVHERAF
jgi:hypothetical protein